jgi:hypothetical protein
MPKTEPTQSLLKRLQKIEAAHGQLGELASRIRAQADTIADLVRLGQTFIRDSATSPAKRGTAKRGTAKRGTAKRGTATRSTAKPSTAKRASATRPAVKRTTAKRATATGPAAKAATPKRTTVRRSTATRTASPARPSSA